MKSYYKKIGLIFTTCFLVGQANKALAQATAITNYSTIQWSQISSNELATIVKNADPSKIPANAWGTILKQVDWFQLPTNVQHYVSDNVDWSLIPTNILNFYNQPGEWADSPQKQITLKRCVEIMRSSVDTNWLAIVADKLTNQPIIFQFTNRLKDGTETVLMVTNLDIIFYFKGFSKRLVSTLNEYASYLTNSQLKTYIGVECEGEMPSPSEQNRMIHFGFRSNEGPIRTFILQGGVRDLSAGVAADFYANGKLAQLRFFTPHHMHDEDIRFNGNGQIQHFSWIMTDKFSLHLDMDESGNSHVNGYFLRKPSAATAK